MDIEKFIIEQALILIPVLVVLGTIIKAIPGLPDWTIPFVLLVFGIVGAIGMMGVTVEAAIQGVLVTGAAVLTHQAYKQITKAGE